MNVSQSRALVAAALLTFTLAGCSGGGVSPQLTRTVQPQPNGAAPGSGTSAIYMLSPSGGSYALPLPRGSNGLIAIGANNAPHGTSLQLNLTEAGVGGSEFAGAPATIDPFPILIGLQVPVTVTIPVPGFTFTFPPNVCLSGKFDVAFFDPTMAVNPPLNPSFLGHAVASGHTLTFTPPHGRTLTLVGGVLYTFTIARDVSNAYPGAASSVIIPVQTATLQPLADVGPLGADVHYDIANGAGFLQWQTISGAPSGVQPAIHRDGPTESVVVSGTQAVTFRSITVTGDFSNGGSLPPSAGLGGPGSFVPDANPKVFGPFPATLVGRKATFTVTPDSGLRVDSHRAWNFSLVTVTACVPVDVLKPCDSPAGTNARTSVPINTNFHVLVSDASGLLTKEYGLTVSAPCSTAGINQNDNDGDVPPGYNDNPTGPNAEFTVLSGRTQCTCTLKVSYRGKPVVETNIEIGTSTDALRPPVNGPRGYAVSGSIR